MYQLLNLINSLENVLQKTVGVESISLKISNNPNFDFQINNVYPLNKPLIIIIKTTNGESPSIKIPTLN